MKPLPCPFCHRLPITRVRKSRDNGRAFAFTLCPRDWHPRTDRLRSGSGSDAIESEADWNSKVAEMKP